MSIKEKSIVSLTYELKLNDQNGELIETVEKDAPFVFLFGTGGLLESFESNIKGLRAKDLFSFQLKCKEAYGEYSDDMIADLPLEIFKNDDGSIEDGMLQLGNVIPMQDESGHHMNGIVVEVSKESIKMDFNHPLSGKDLFFKGEIIDVRDATKEELDHGHVHGEHGHHH